MMILKVESCVQNLNMFAEKVCDCVPGELLPFFPMTDSGDVSSTKEVDILELLRVASSCQPEDILSLCHKTQITLKIALQKVLIYTTPNTNGLVIFERISTVLSKSLFK